MLSNPYESRKIAEEVAKNYAQEHKISKIILILEPKKGLYYFSDQDQALNNKMIAFRKLKLIRGKWKDRTLT